MFFCQKNLKNWGIDPNGLTDIFCALSENAQILVTWQTYASHFPPQGLQFVQFRHFFRTNIWRIFSVVSMVTLSWVIDRYQSHYRSHKSHQVILYPPGIFTLMVLNLFSRLFFLQINQKNKFNLFELTFTLWNQSIQSIQIMHLRSNWF